MKKYFQRYLIYLFYRTRDEKLPDEFFSETKELVGYYLRLTQKWRPSCCISPHGFQFGYNAYSFIYAG